MSASTLQDLQQAFSEALFNTADTQIHTSLKGSSDHAKHKRLDIYRNNVFYSLTDTLADLYPVIKRLVGEQFFNATANEYIHRHPPASAAMVDFGADFPEFLQIFEHTSELGYPADVARLELAWHQAYHAADLDALTAADFSTVPPELLGQATLELHPSVRLLESPFPVLKIWNANQEGNEGDGVIDLDSGGEKLCVYRPRYDVNVRELDKAMYALLRSLQQDANLEFAMCQAEEAASESTISEIFALCIKEGLFSKIVED